jgi:predicted dehydrogenase
MINVAVAGFGWWGQHIVDRLQSNDKLVACAVVEPNEQHHAAITEKGLTAYSEFDAVLNDPQIDAIVLTTPNSLHEAQVCAAAEAGKHVYCEKPLGLTGASARRSIEACKKAGIVVGIGHERRFEPALQELRRRVQDGELGTIMHAEAAFSHDKLINVPPGDWRTVPETAPAASMTAMGIHLTDFYIALFGRVSSVQAMTTKRKLDWETGDVVTVQLGFEAGMTATLNAVLYTPHFIRTHVFGTDQWVEVRSDTHPDTPGGKTEFVAMTTANGAKTQTFDWVDTVSANLEAFADAIEGRKAYPIEHWEMVHNIEVLEAIAASAQNRQTIHL